MAAILSSLMEVSYCTSGFFVITPAKQCRSVSVLPFLHGLESCIHLDYRAVNTRQMIAPNPEI